MEQNMVTIEKNRAALDSVLQSQLDEMRKKKRYYKSMAKKFKA
jgi:hypothetical protein